MSGPKVVRVVSREERQTTAREAIAKFEVAAQRLLKASRRLERDVDAIESALAGKRRVIESLYAADRWAELAQQAALETQFLQSELQRLQTASVAQLTDRRYQRQQVADAARSMTMAFEAAGQSAPAALRDIAAQAARASAPELDRLRVELSTTFGQLQREGLANGSRDASQDALAHRLVAGQTSQTLSDWSRQQMPVPTEAPQLAQLLGTAELLGSEEYPSFLTRADSIRGELSASRRQLLLDSLLFDLRAHVAELERRARVVDELVAVQAGLAEAPALRDSDIMRRVSSALHQQWTQEHDALVSLATTVLAEGQRRLAADARRRAVLQGLAGLGYEVRESMTTTWARDGRIVVKKPSNTDYGVELGALADAERMQVRLVGALHPAQARTPEQDLDQERSWCGEFSQLMGSLKSSGADLIIERAIGVGTQPVKSLALATDEVVTEEEAQLRALSSNKS